MRRASFCLLACGMFALGGGLIGQDKKTDPPKDDTPAKKGQMPFGWTKAALGLTDDQKKKVLEVGAKYDTEIDALKKKIDDLKKKKQDEEVAVLTAEQKKKLEDYFKSKAGTGSGK